MRKGGERRGDRKSGARTRRSAIQGPKKMLLWIVRHPAFDPIRFRFAQTESRRRDYSVHLIRAPRADDGCRNCRMPQRPGNGYHARLNTVLAPDLPEQIDESQVSLKERRLGIRAALPPVVFGQILYTLSGHFPGQQSGDHRRIVDHADSMVLAEGKYS